MQDTQTDWHIMMVASLVLVAASAIFQTAVGLDADKLSAVQSQRMFATVVAASGTTTNPKVEHYAKQLRSIEVVDNGHSRIRGIVTSVASRGIAVTSWGGEWKIVVSSATKLVAQNGKLDLSSIKEGDYVFVEGIAENSGAPVVSAQTIADYTAYRIPSGKDESRLGDAHPPFGEMQVPVSATNTPPRMLPPVQRTSVSPASPSIESGTAGVVEVKTFPVEPRRVPLQKSIDR